MTHSFLSKINNNFENVQKNYSRTTRKGEKWSKEWRPEIRSTEWETEIILQSSSFFFLRFACISLGGCQQLSCARVWKSLRFIGSGATSIWRSPHNCRLSEVDLHWAAGWKEVFCVMASCMMWQEERGILMVARAQARRLLTLSHIHEYLRAHKQNIDIHA